MKQSLVGVKEPRVLEIGVDTGSTFVPMLSFLARTFAKFELVGVDVKFPDFIPIIVSNMDLMPTQRCVLIEDNSLVVLPKFIESKDSFDLVLIDGDHNYYTVSRELLYVKKLVKESSMVIVDDYNGKWAFRDLWYSERPGYETSEKASKRIDTKFQGVRPAVDEFVSLNRSWNMQQGGDAVVLSRTST